MNKILLHDATPYVNSEILSIDNAYSQDASVNLYDPSTKFNVINYANLDGAGTDMLDYTLEAADYNDCVGLISEYISNDTGGFSGNRYSPYITLTFDHPIDLTKGISIKTHPDVDESNKRADIVIHLRDVDDNIFSVNVITEDYIGFENFEYENILEMTLWINTIEGKGNNLKIDYIDFGTDVEIDGFVGDISVYGELCLEKNDCPAGTCDFTIQTDRELLEGQQFKLITNHYEASYVIESITREAEDIYTVQAHDYVQEMENRNDENFRQLGCPINIEFTEDVYHGIWDDKMTLRQWAAYLQPTQDFYIVGFKSDGLRSLKPQTTISKTYQDWEVLGRASYQYRKGYWAVFMEYENLLDPDLTNYEAEVDTGASKIGSLGRLELSKWMCRPAVNGTANGVYAMLDSVKKFCNGNEVEFEAEYSGENLGDYVTVPTLYNGYVHGLIRSIELTIGKNKAVARMIVREARPYV